MKINWGNIIENAINQIVTFLGITILGYYVLVPVLKETIQKETTKIENTFQTEIKKLKSRDGGTVDFRIDPEIENNAQTNVNKDSVPEREGFFKRLFGKKKQ